MLLVAVAASSELGLGNGINRGHDVIDTRMVAEHLLQRRSRVETNTSVPFQGTLFILVAK